MRRRMGRFFVPTLWLFGVACGSSDTGDPDAELVDAVCEKEQACDPDGFAEDYESFQDCVDQSSISPDLSTQCREALRTASQCVVDNSCGDLAEGACAEESAAILIACLDDL